MLGLYSSTVRRTCRCYEEHSEVICASSLSTHSSIFYHMRSGLRLTRRQYRRVYGSVLFVSSLRTGTLTAYTGEVMGSSVWFKRK